MTTINSTRSATTVQKVGEPRRPGGFGRDGHRRGSGSPTAELPALRHVGHVQTFPRHAQLAIQEASVDWLCVLLEGHAKTHHLTRDGREVILSLHGPGDLLGARAAAGRDEVAICSVTALGPLKALVVRGSGARWLVDHDPYVRSAVHRTLAWRLREAEISLVVQSTCNARRRIASRLLELTERWGRRRGGAIEIETELTQEELGSWAGLSREATVKALGELRDDDVLRTSRRHITVLDLDQLRRSTSTVVA